MKKYYAVSLAEGPQIVFAADPPTDVPPELLAAGFDQKQYYELPWEMYTLSPDGIYLDGETPKPKTPVEISCSTGLIHADGTDTCVVQIINRATNSLVLATVVVNGETVEYDGEPLELGPTTEPGTWNVSLPVNSPYWSDPVVIIATTAEETP